ncbi:MAG: hypothetical protein ACI8UR_000217 [Natronomonas sp.]|jgi:hypothetical protein|uniref:hypothetical protein n=1 Tax=Natronomonas sp. TaxID=2184060 RepID=UPI0039897911
MGITVPFCDTPGQSVVIGLLAGAIGGAVGLLVGLQPLGVAVVAGMLALVGELAGHLLRGDQQFRDAVQQVRGGWE